MVPMHSDFKKQRCCQWQRGWPHLCMNTPAPLRAVLAIKSESTICSCGPAPAIPCGDIPIAPPCAHRYIMLRVDFRSLTVWSCLSHKKRVHNLQLGPRTRHFLRRHPNSAALRADKYIMLRVGFRSLMTL